MITRARAWRVLLVVLLTATGTALARADDAGASPAGARLAALQEDLVQLRFEKALAGIEELLGEPSLAEEDRADALILRSDAHVALGDLKAAERDYREILALRPAYVPDESRMPSKARERFDKIRGESVGRLRPRIEPADARLWVDGRASALDTAGGVPLLAGDHAVRAEREGYDPLEQPVKIEAGREHELVLRLVPNARTVVIRSEPEGVVVSLDGVPVGRTARPLSEGAAPAELRIENLPLGEHAFELSKPCFRTERRQDSLTVDLLDAGPKTYDIVRMVEVHGVLGLRGGPSGAGVLIDDEPAGTLPLEPIEVCPGQHALVVSYGGRRIWSSLESVSESGESVIEIVPRPNVVLAGSETWPPRLAGLALSNWIAARPLPPDERLDDPRAWHGFDLAQDTDLVVAVRPSKRAGAPDEFFLYSPILDIAAPVDTAPGFSRPSWTRPIWGLKSVDSRIGGAARVSEVTAGGPAARAGLAVGDRVLGAGGIDVEGAAALRRILEVASPKAPLELRWLRPDGAQRQASLQASLSPRLEVEPPLPVDAMIRAAWAAVDGAAQPPSEAAPALANLALLFAAFDRAERAIETWQLVDWQGRRGVGDGTTRYRMAIELERRGRVRVALAALREAAASDSTDFDDEGPSIAPAARDRLARLGSPSDR